MPRDTLSPDAVEVRLPGGRRGKLAAADDAGVFRIVLRGATWLDRLYELGWLSRDQREAGETLAQLFEAAGIRPHLGCRHETAIDSFGGDDTLLERLNACEIAAWRRMHQLLGACPPGARTVVGDVCCWGRPPTSLPQLRRGLNAVARALRTPRPR